MSHDGYDQNSSLESNESQREPQPELKPEELERNASLSKREDSSTISLTRLKSNNDEDHLIQVSDINEKKGGGVMCNNKDNGNESKEEDEQISYVISRQTSQDESTSLIFS